MGLDFLLKRVKVRGDMIEPSDVFPNEFLKEISFQESEISSYGAFRLSYTPSKSDLDLTVSGIYDLRSGEPFVMFTSSYNWADAVNLRLGAVLSGKKGRSPFTQMGKHLGQLGYFEVRYSF